MATNPSDANINTDLMGRISRLEAENRKLKEEMNDHKRQLIPGQVDKGAILVLGGEKDGRGGRKEGRGSDKMVILKQDKWIKLALKLPKVLDQGGAVYLDRKIYIFGGISMKKELHKLDNETLKWIRLADMNEDRQCINNSSVEWNGSIWVFGGDDVDKMALSKSVERYDPKENKWIKMPWAKIKRPK